MHYSMLIVLEEVRIKLFTWINFCICIFLFISFTYWDRISGTWINMENKGKGGNKDFSSLVGVRTFLLLLYHFIYFICFPNISVYILMHTFIKTYKLAHKHTQLTHAHTHTHTSTHTHTQALTHTQTLNIQV